MFICLFLYFFFVYNLDPVSHQSILSSIDIPLHTFLFSCLVIQNRQHLHFQASDAPVVVGLNITYHRELRGSVFSVSSAQLWNFTVNFLIHHLGPASDIYTPFSSFYLVFFSFSFLHTCSTIFLFVCPVSFIPTIQNPPSYLQS